MNKSEVINAFSLMHVLDRMEGISLDKMDKVKLLNRFDSKFGMQISKLTDILNEIQEDYYVLDIGGKRIQFYSSVYFDTPENRFYVAHHNGKGSRFKIRKRSYQDSGISFTEIKEKTNKGKTIKNRIRSFSKPDEISAVDKHIISDKLHIDPDKLVIKSKNRFNRITVVSKNFDERCTIDLNLVFGMNGESTKIQDFVIIELKQGKRNQHSKFALSLKRHHVYPTGFSKYCIGRALLEDGIKKNMFKYKLLVIKREYNLIKAEKQDLPEVFAHN